MNKHYIKRQDGSIYIINAKSPEQFLQDPDTDVVLTSVDQAEIDAHELNKVRQRKLQDMRTCRVPKLEEADVEINKIMDGAGEMDADLPLWRSYRKDLRDITESYKADMSTLDSVEDVETDVTWPTKP